MRRRKPVCFKFIYTISNVSINQVLNSRKNVCFKLSKNRKPHLNTLYTCMSHSVFLESYERKLPGFSLEVSNSSSPNTDSELCYKDHSESISAPTSITLNNCSSGSYVWLYNSRISFEGPGPLSKWPNLMLTEVQVLAEKGMEIFGSVHEILTVYTHVKMW